SDALLQHLVAVDVHKLLRYARQERGGDLADFGALPGGCHEFVQVVCQKRDVLAGAILQDKRKAAGGPDARDRRRGESEDSSRWKPAEFLVKTVFDGLIFFAPLFALIPWLQSNEEESVITGSDKAEQTETNHARRVLDPGGVCKNLLHLSRRSVCAFLGSR